MTWPKFGMENFLNQFLVISATFTSKLIVTLIFSILLSCCIHQPKGNYYIFSVTQLYFTGLEAWLNMIFGMENHILKSVFSHISCIHFQINCWFSVDHSIGAYANQRVTIILFSVTQAYFNRLEACLDLILVWRILFLNLFLVISATFTSKLIWTLTFSMLLSWCIH